MIGADFGQCNTSAKSGALYGRMPDAQMPLNIGEIQRSMAAAEITSATLQCFFWPFTLAEKCKNIGLLQDDDSTNATQRLFCFTQIMVKLFLSTQVIIFRTPQKDGILTRHPSRVNQRCDLSHLRFSGLNNFFHLRSHLTSYTLCVVKWLHI